MSGGQVEADGVGGGGAEVFDGVGEAGQFLLKTLLDGGHQFGYGEGDEQVLRIVFAAGNNYIFDITIILHATSEGLASGTGDLVGRGLEEGAVLVLADLVNDVHGGGLAAGGEAGADAEAVDLGPAAR